METIVINTTEPSKIEQIIAFLKEIQVSFSLKSQEKEYNKEFVEKIERSRKEYKEGKGTTITIEELNNLWK